MKHLSSILEVVLLICCTSFSYAKTTNWNGSALDDDFYNAANWTGGVPVNGDDVAFPAGIPAAVVITQNISLTSLSISSNATVNIASGIILSVAGAGIALEGFLIPQQGSILNTNITLVNSGNFQGETTVNGNVTNAGTMAGTSGTGITIIGNLTNSATITSSNVHVSGNTTNIGSGSCTSCTPPIPVSPWMVVLALGAISIVVISRKKMMTNTI